MHGQIYPQNWAISKNVRREQVRKTERNFRVFRKRDAARTDIPQNWAVSKNVTQYGQIYPQAEQSAKT